jgi:hypothetical protein
VILSEQKCAILERKNCDTYRFGTNINFLLEEYGIMVNSDSVVRTNFYKYFHPKVNFTSAIHPFSNNFYKYILPS